MAEKRSKETITLGSGKLYLMEYTDALPEVTDICKDENLIGYIKGGAALSYTEETYEEKDDLGLASKIITTKETATLKAGLVTWNGDSIQKIIDRAKTTTSTDGSRRITKIGGAGNAKGGYYAICFFHEDKTDGNLWVLIKGRNTAGFTITFAVDSGTVLEPEFTAMPHDDAGTLIELIEELQAAA